MKRFYASIIALLLAVSFSLPASAAWSIRQKGNGAAVWSDSGANEIPIGTGGVNVAISSFAQTVTYFVVTPKPGRVRKIYAVNMGGFNAQSAAPTFDVRVGLGINPGAFTPVSVGGTFTMTTNLSAGVASSKSFTGTETVLPAGGVIAIAVTGTNVSAVPGIITIVIE